MTPMATILPRSRNGGTSEKFMVKKPIAVVMLNAAAKSVHWKVIHHLREYEFADVHNLPLKSLKIP